MRLVRCRRFQTPINSAVALEARAMKEEGGTRFRVGRWVWMRKVTIFQAVAAERWALMISS